MDWHGVEVFEYSDSGYGFPVTMSYADRSEAIKLAWGRALEILEKEGYQSAVVMARRLRQHLKRFDRTVEEFHTKRLHAQVLAEKYNNPPLDGIDVQMLIGRSIWTRIDELDGAHWTIDLEDDETPDLLIPGNLRITRKLDDEEMAEHGINPEHLSAMCIYTFSGSERWIDAVKQYQARNEEVKRQQGLFSATSSLVRLRSSILENVLYQYEVLGTANYPTEDAISYLLASMRLTENELLETLSFLIVEIEQNKKATNFVRDICGGIAERSFVSHAAVRDRIIQNLLPVLRDAFPDLDLPKGTKLKEWQRFLPNLRTALAKWQRKTI